MKIRTHHCMECDHLWAYPVTIARYTPNISGEATVYCPKCDAKNVHSGPVQETNNWDYEPGCLDRTEGVLMDDELRRMKYRQKKRQRLTCTLTHEEMILLEAEEKRLHRALNDLEMFVLFGKINSKGQRVMPTGGLWKGVQRAKKEKNTNQTVPAVPSDVAD